MTKRTNYIATKYEHLRFDDLPNWAKTIMRIEDTTIARHPTPSEIRETNGPDPIDVLRLNVSAIRTHHNNPFRR